MSSKRKRTSANDASSSTAPVASPTTRSSASALALTSTTTLRIPETPSRRALRTAVFASGSPSPQKHAHTSTPKRNVQFTEDTLSPTVVTNADRSARRKSVRRIITHEGSDDSEVDDINLARRIYSGSEASSSDDDDEAGTDLGATSSKPKRKPGRPPKTAKPRSPSPPPAALEGVDSYFHQNRKVRQQTSTKTLASLPQLDHTTYFTLLRSHPESHPLERAALLESYETDYFGQFLFELSQGFNLLFYGYGSKRHLLTSLAEQIYTVPGSVVVVNGYLPALTVRDILSTISTALLGAEHTTRLTATVENILALLTAAPGPLTLLIHNLDGEALRAEKSQTLLARLAAHPNVSVVASIDHIRAPLLWDAARISQFNFLWHDGTTFEPYTVEIPADEALSLVDGAGRAGGTKGVKYVLASLPSNAKSLFRVLVSHQLEAMAEAGDAGAGKKAGGEEVGVEYRVLYQRAVSEFICSNDVAFRTLLKEFQDHQMVSSRKDGSGMEVFWAPFRREDLEGILEEILV